MGISTPSNTWFIGPTRVHNPTACRSVQPFVQGSRHRPTDSRPRYSNRPYIGRIYVHSTAMRHVKITRRALVERVDCVVKIRQDCRRGIVRLTCLPESLRTARTTVVSTAHNPSFNLNNNVTSTTGSSLSVCLSVQSVCRSLS